MQARHDRQRSMCVTTSAVAGAVVLQHLLDQVDAAARRIELVAEQHIGRTGRGAEAAMHAGAQNLVRPPRCRDRQAGRGRNWSASHPRPHAAGIEHALRIEALLHAPGRARRARPCCGSNTSTAARIAAGARISVACPPARDRGAQIAPRRRSSGWRQRDPDESAGPVVEHCAPAASISRSIRRRVPARSRCATAVRRRADPPARTAPRRGRCARASRECASSMRLHRAERLAAMPPAHPCDA